jgi:hypothetical protein
MDRIKSYVGDFDEHNQFEEDPGFCEAASRF